MYLRCNKTLFCAFIDYRKAFDSVDRCALWHKLLQYCIDGKMFKIIHNMYESAKSCVHLGTKLSDHFYSNVGVRQDAQNNVLLQRKYISIKHFKLKI
jgi:hypothetical protein